MGHIDKYEMSQADRDRANAVKLPTIDAWFADSNPASKGVDRFDQVCRMQYRIGVTRAFMEIDRLIGHGTADALTTLMNTLRSEVQTLTAAVVSYETFAAQSVALAGEIADMPGPIARAMKGPLLVPTFTPEKQADIGRRLKMALKRGDTKQFVMILREVPTPPLALYGAKTFVDNEFIPCDLITVELRAREIVAERVADSVTYDDALESAAKEHLVHRVFATTDPHALQPIISAMPPDTLLRVARLAIEASATLNKFGLANVTDGKVSELVGVEIIRRGLNLEDEPEVEAAT